MSTADTHPSLRVVIEDTVDQATRMVADLFKTIICDAVAQRNACFLALAGGTTPRLLYQRLAGEVPTQPLPWESVEVFFGDERDVPQDDVDSNFRMAQRTLLDHVPVPPDQIHPMPADAADLAAAAEGYEQAIREVVPADDGTPRFDIVLLGMGGDGHTASLFPDTPALQERQKLVAGQFVPVLGRSRMTFTYPLINAARNIILLVTGPDKAESVATLLHGDADARSRIPAAGVRPTDGIVYLILDREAARLIEHTE